MKDLAKKALEISNNHPFSSFPSQAVEGGDNKIAPCCSGPDKKFMERLERGEHLDTDKLPL